MFDIREIRHVISTNWTTCKIQIVTLTILGVYAVHITVRIAIVLISAFARFDIGVVIQI